MTPSPDTGDGLVDFTVQIAVTGGREALHRALTHLQMIGRIEAWSDTYDVHDLLSRISALEGEVEGLKTSQSQPVTAQTSLATSDAKPSAVWSLEHIEHWLRQALIKAQMEANHRFPECEAKAAFIAGAQIAIREVAVRLLPTPLTAPPPRLPDSPTEGWQDIESAPRDGTRVLVWGERRTSCVHPWVEMEIAEIAVLIGACWRNDQSGDVLRPTHWMPLPTPPSGEGGS